MKKHIIILFLFAFTINAQTLKPGDAKGLFLSAGAGAGIPIGHFSNTNNPGGGFDFALSYTDNLIMPVFLNASIGYTHFPGSQDYYSASDHSSFSSNVIIGSLGIRYYLPPIMDNIILLMPVIDLSGLYANFNDYHQFKAGTGKKDFNEHYSKFGFQAGAGISLFMFDITAYYNYLPGRNFISLGLRTRIPIFATM